jgi:predicted metal-dependent hydrolase
MEIEVVRSRRRRKTVQAQLVDGVLRIAIPDHLTGDEEAHWVEVMQAKFVGRRDPAAIDLPARARRLAARYLLPFPNEIVWSTRQKTRWGSCSVETRRIRISERVAAFPKWVLDYVIVHELAHLQEPDHGPAFWELVNRYKMAERARGYLIAKGDAAGAPDPDADDLV